MNQLLKGLEQKKAEMLALLRRLVEMESPSTDKAAVDRVGRLLAECIAQRGANVRVFPSPLSGDILRAEFRVALGRAKGQILLLGHMDTVWEMGTLAKMPFRIAQGRAYGPGSFDMKAGIVIALFALDAVRAASEGMRKNVVLLLTADEETGSKASRGMIEKEARKSDCALVLESAHGPHGALKTARKGVGEYEIRVQGRAAHAGLEPEKGASAIVELSRQVLRVLDFADAKRGITINPGVIQGGTRGNVVAAEATARVDVRITRLADGAKLHRQFMGLKPFDKRTKLTVSGGINRPPLERTAGTVELFGKAQQVGRELGMNLNEVAVGGGSDGNFTSALGVPTLDGLGAVGDGAHASYEHVVISELPRRAALLARLILELGK